VKNSATPKKRGPIDKGVLFVILLSVGVYVGVLWGIKAG